MDFAGSRRISALSSSCPWLQESDRVCPARLKVPNAEAVTHGIRKLPGAAGVNVRLLLGRSGLKPAAASMVLQLLIARGIVAAAFHMVPGLARAEVAPIDGFHDLDAIGEMAMVDEEQGEGELDPDQRRRPEDC